MKNLAENLSTALTHFFKTSVFAMTDYSAGPTRLSTTNGSFSGGFQLKRVKRFFKNSPYIPFVLVGVVVFIIIILIVRGFISKQSTSTLGSTTTKQISVAKPLSQETLNKDFDFPLKDANGKTLSKFQYEIQSAELDNQIIIKGQVATAVQGRVFLILNLKITNNFDKDVQLNTKDYVRLIVNNSSDKLAADIHNDPVDVQAISTKFTRIGFPIDAAAKNLKLEVGEIDGSKQTIQLNLK